MRFLFTLCISFLVCFFSSEKVNAQQLAYKWAIKAGTSVSDGGNDIITGPDMCSYVGGWYNDRDPYVIKLSPTGTVMWADRYVANVGSTGRCYGVALDSSGNVYTCGEFNGTIDAKPGAGTVSLVSNGSSDIYIIKLDSAGNYVWSKQVGGTNTEFCYDIAVDNAGNAILTGRFAGQVDFNPGISTYNMTAVGTADIFILKLNSLGNFMWAKKFGSSFGVGYGIATDTANNIYVTGSFNGAADFDPGPGINMLTPAGGSDVFVLKLDAAGNHIWAVSAGGSGNEVGNDIYVDASGNVFVSGEFQGIADLDPGAGITNDTSKGLRDIFVLKLDTVGGYVWSKTAGGTGNDVGFGVVCDKFGHVCSTGYFNSTADFDPGSGVYNLTSAGTSDVFFWQLDSLGNFYQAMRFSSISGDVGNGIATDSAGGIYLTGYFQLGIDFDPEPGSGNLISSGSHDLYAAHLGICYPTFDSISDTACDSYISPGGSHTWYTTGVYQDTVVNSNGCDSILTVYLTIKHSSGTAQTVSTCNEYLFAGNLLYSSGTYYDTLTNAVLCDSIITLYLTVNHDKDTLLPVNACDSFYFGGNMLYTSGIYFDTIPTMAGCDSAITLILSIHHDTDTTLNFITCDSFLFNGSLLTSSGIYYDTIPSIAGCDSTITLNLIVNTSTDNNPTVSACSSYFFNGNTLTSSGTYYDTIPNMAGCDSVIILILTIHTNTDTNLTISACDSYFFNGNTLTSSGIYYDTIPNTAGCDSIIILNLTLHNNTDTNIYISACDSFQFNGTLLTTSGLYFDTIPNTVGCDSIIWLHLTINPEYSFTESQSICNGETFHWQGNDYTTPDTYTSYYSSINGCDSTYTLHLTVNPVYLFTESHSICNGETFHWQGNDYTSANTYTEYYTTQYGCDSIYNLNLTVNSVDVGLTLTGITITADSTADGYQWLNCDNAFAIITGAVNQNFIPMANGNYAVIITQGLCSDTSACVNVTTVGIQSIQNNEPEVYPNPISDHIIIRVNDVLFGSYYSLIDLWGRTIINGQIKSEYSMINIYKLLPGIYFLRFEDQNTRSIRIVKI